MQVKLKTVKGSVYCCPNALKNTFRDGIVVSFVANQGTTKIYKISETPPNGKGESCSYLLVVSMPQDFYDSEKNEWFIKWTCQPIVDS